MRRELEESERERERLQRRIERLEKQNTRLKRELDAARRAGYRQAAPFAKTVTREPKRSGRRAGAQYGQPARRCRPTRVDVRHDVPLPASCPDCGGRVRSTGMATQFQEELPVPRVLVREFRVALGACQDCGQLVRGRHRLQTSDAFGAAAVQLGPALVASAVILNKQMGLSFGKIAPGRAAAEQALVPREPAGGEPVVRTGRDRQVAVGISDSRSRQGASAHVVPPPFERTGSLLARRGAGFATNTSSLRPTGCGTWPWYASGVARRPSRLRLRPTKHVGLGRLLTLLQRAAGAALRPWQ